MKLKHLLFATLLIPATASAQTTIQGAALNGWAPPDTMKDITNVTAGVAVNGNWDLTTATYNTNFFRTTDEVATLPALPLASFRKFISYGLSPAMSYMSALYWGKDANGVYNYGEHIERQASGLGAATMNPQDSLIFPEQTVVYSVPEKTMAFPMHFGDTWSSTAHQTVNFELTVNMFGMFNTPGERRSVVEMSDSVKGWGKMRVKNLNGQTSAYMDVLVVQETEHTSDSFYLGGAPAPSTLLDAFGLSQGQSESRYTTLFYRSGEVTPLLRLEHTDSTFTTTTGAVVMNSRIPVPPVTGIENLQQADLFRVYPNPVTNGTLHIDGITSGSKWTYTLISVNGQVLLKGIVTSSDATVNIADAADGVYILNLVKDGVMQGGQFVIVGQ